MCDHHWKIMRAGPIAVRLCLSCGAIAHLPPPIDDTPAEVAAAGESDDPADAAFADGYDEGEPANHK